MAGDWIKMRTNIGRCPQVLRISSALKADRLRTVGALHAIWSLADEQTEEGILDAYTFDLIDEMIGWKGFCAAMSSVGWIDQTEKGVEFPRFAEHNGASAKRRAQESDRKRSARLSAQSAASDADKKRTREEKRREEVKPSRAPRSGLNGAFANFWQAYPKKKSKGDAEKAWLSIKPDERLTEQILSSVERAKTSADWRKNGGQFIPHPATWLRARGWEDQLQFAPVMPGERHPDGTIQVAI